MVLLLILISQLLLLKYSPRNLTSFATDPLKSVFSWGASMKWNANPPNTIMNMYTSIRIATTFPLNIPASSPLGLPSSDDLLALSSFDVIVRCCWSQVKASRGIETMTFYMMTCFAYISHVLSADGTFKTGSNWIVAVVLQLCTSNILYIYAGLLLLLSINTCERAQLPTELTHRFCLEYITIISPLAKVK